MPSTATLDLIEARAHSALAGTTRLGGALRAARSHVAVLFYDCWNVYLLRRLLAILTQDGLRTLTAAEAVSIAVHLEELRRKLAALLTLAEQKGLVRMPVHRAFMRDIRRGHEHVVDVLEGLYLALDDDFRELVNQAIGDLRTKRAGGDWRTALAALPD